MLRWLLRVLVGEPRPAFAYEVTADGHRVRVEAPTMAGLRELAAAAFVDLTGDDPNRLYLSPGMVDDTSVRQLAAQWATRDALAGA